MCFQKILFLLFIAIVGIEAKPSDKIRIRSLDTWVGVYGLEEDSSYQLYVKICPKTGYGVCCKTNNLNHNLSNDWAENSREVWVGDRLGHCENYPIRPQNELEVTLSVITNEKRFELLLNDIEITATSSGGILGRYNCGYFHLKSGESHEETKTCSVTTKTWKDWQFTG